MKGVGTLHHSAHRHRSRLFNVVQRFYDTRPVHKRGGTPDVADRNRYIR